MFSDHIFCYDARFDFNLSGDQNLDPVNDAQIGFHFRNDYVFERSWSLWKIAWHERKNTSTKAILPCPLNRQAITLGHKIIPT